MYPLEATRLGKKVKQFQIDTKRNHIETRTSIAFWRWCGQFNRTLLMTSKDLLEAQGEHI